MGTVEAYGKAWAISSAFLNSHQLLFLQASSSEIQLNQKLGGSTFFVCLFNLEASLNQETYV